MDFDYTVKTENYLTKLIRLSEELLREAKYEAINVSHKKFLV